ncbi:hypothetical protein L3V83_08600 [Thiotrichales bacterium 19X7-9]|nr:hypothetical protein [Thiotrichales bacterium 19X7-9]
MLSLTKVMLSIGLMVIIIGSLIGGSYAGKVVYNDQAKVYNHNLSKIYLYQSPSKESSYTKIDLSTPFVKIYKDDGWVKVGNTANGQIGWVNLAQYKKAHEIWKAQLNKNYQIVETKKTADGTIKITEGQKDGVRYMIVAKKTIENNN